MIGLALGPVLLSDSHVFSSLRAIKQTERKVMGIVKQAMNEAHRSLICLKHTKTIEAEDIASPEYALLKEEYDTHQNGGWIEKALVSILASAIYQRRVAFVLSRRTLRTLLRSDKNWVKPPGFKDESYPEFLQQAMNSGILQLIDRGWRAHAFEITHPDVLRLVGADVAKHRREALAFVNKPLGLEPDDQELGNHQGNQEEEQEEE
jgi:hypothetical protein